MKRSALLRFARGFSVIELMITLTVLAVLMGVAAPNVSEYARNRRITGTVNDLLAALYTARTEAIKRQLPATVCFTNDPNAAVPTCNGDGTAGWVAFIDTNSNELAEVGEQVVLRHDAIPGTLSVVRQPTTTARVVSYAGNGFTRTSVANPLSGIVFCDDRKNSVVCGDLSAARGLVVDVTGRPWITKSHSEIASHASLLNGVSGGSC